MQGAPPLSGGLALQGGLEGAGDWAGPQPGMPNFKEWQGIAGLSMFLESKEPEVTAGQH